MTSKNIEPELNKEGRIRKHDQREKGKKSLDYNDHNHGHLKPNERNHNYMYLQHLEEYENKDEADE